MHARPAAPRRTPHAASLLLLLLLLAACPMAPASAQKKPIRAPVGIVGAGMAGVRAASVLNEAGVDFLVLEADSQIGGRMRNQEIVPGSGEVGLV